MKKSIKNQLNAVPVASSWRCAPTAFVAAAAVCAAFALAANAQEAPTNLVQLAMSDFNSGSDGWLQGGDGLTTIQPNYLPSGGASGGGIASGSSKDFFLAPVKFRGDLHKAYGGKLRFDLRQSAGSGFSYVFSVRLQSGGLILANFIPQSPPLTWTTFEFALIETHGWVNRNAGRPATREEMLAVLSNLDGLWIRARFSSNTGASGWLDNVELLGPQSGSAQGELGIQQLPVISLVAEVGVSYRIEFSPTLGAGAVWTKLADVVLTSIPYQFIDTDAAGHPSRFYRLVKNN